MSMFYCTYATYINKYALPYVKIRPSSEKHFFYIYPKVNVHYSLEHRKDYDGYF